MFLMCCQYGSEQQFSRSQSEQLFLPLLIKYPGSATKALDSGVSSEHSDGGQETLPIWPIYDTCVFFKVTSISSSPSD